MKKPTAKPTLEGGNEDKIRATVAKPISDDGVSALLLLIAQVMDYQASGGDAYVTFTANRSRTECMVTLGIEGQKVYGTHPTFTGLLTLMPSLL